jgi:hypothetical protein
MSTRHWQDVEPAHLPSGEIIHAERASKVHETFTHDADLIVRGAVYTMDIARPVAEAFAVRDGKVAAVGDVAEVMALRAGALG